MAPWQLELSHLSLPFCTCYMRLCWMLTSTIHFCISPSFQVDIESDDGLHSLSYTEQIDYAKKMSMAGGADSMPPEPQSIEITEANNSVSKLPHSYISVASSAYVKERVMPPAATSLRLKHAAFGDLPIVLAH